MSKNKEVRELVQQLEAEGWRVERKKKGWMLYPPDKDGTPVMAHVSPSDGRALDNLRADIRRATQRSPA